MKYKVYFACKGGSQDYFVIDGETIAELKEKTLAELKKRDAIGLLTEKIED